MTLHNDPLVGHTLGGRFQVIQALDEEELGRVYLAETAGSGDLVQIKVLHPHLVDDHATFSRFGREMLATATIQHPNTVAMLDFGEHNNLWHYLVLEHIEGHTLEQVLELHRQLPVNRAIHIAAQVASALEAAHGEAIVHRNISPRNILLVQGTQDLVKVRDFGLARLASPDDPNSEVTAVNARVGTAAYMAPEYILEGTVDTRSDLYALGCVLFEMLAGEPPFTGESLDVMEAHCSETPRRITKVRRNVPRWLEDIVHNLLHKDPNARIQHPADLIYDLEQGAGHSLEAPTGTARVKLDKRKSRNKLGTAVVGTALGGAIIALLSMAIVAIVMVLLLTS